MRISDAMLRDTALLDLRSRLSALAIAQVHQTTGKRINTMSDSPADAAEVLKIDGQLRDIDLYRRNATLATTRLAAEENVVKAARDLVQQAKELTNSIANTAVGDPLRATVASQLQLIHDQLVSLGNTKLGDEFLFAGGKTDTPPFLSDGTYVGDGTVRKVSLDDALTVDTTHTGDTLLGSSLAALQSAQQLVANGSGNQIQASANALDAAGVDLLTREAEVGARQTAVQNASQTLATRNASLLDQVDQIASVDPTQAAVEIVNAQNALEQAYAVIGRIAGTSLVNFLK